MINNVLVIPDLHAPFIHENALQHCKETYKKYKCNQVIFLGDVIDNAATTHFITNPDGMSPGDELEAAITQLQPWYKAFPNAFVTIGNHCTRINKLMTKTSISEKWLAPYNMVLKVPNWKFVYETTIDGVRYFHGEGASSTAQTLYQSNTSIIYGHWHSKFEVMYNNGKFAMCCGWLANQDAYAFDYARSSIKKGILGCAVVLDNGKLPILCPLNT